MKMVARRVTPARLAEMTHIHRKIGISFAIGRILTLAAFRKTKILRRLKMTVTIVGKSRFMTL
jgi:hypothetical protein